MKFTRLIIALAVLVLVVILYLVGVFRPGVVWLEGAQNFALARVSVSRWSWVGLSAVLADKLKLAEDNRTLRQERDELLAKIVGQDALQRENEFLRGQTKYQPPQGFNRVLGAVIGRSLGDASLLLINRGSDDGVREGNPVLSSGGLLLGRVATVGLKSSGVLPITAVGSKIGIRLLMPDGVTAIAEGSHGLGLRAVFLPYATTIPAGTIVLTAGLEPGVPADLPLGKIGEAKPTPGQLFQEASVIDVATAETTREVIILLPPS